MVLKYKKRPLLTYKHHSKSDGKEKGRVLMYVLLHRANFPVTIMECRFITLWPFTLLSFHFLAEKVLKIVCFALSKFYLLIRRFSFTSNSTNKYYTFPCHLPQMTPTSLLWLQYQRVIPQPSWRQSASEFSVPLHCRSCRRIVPRPAPNMVAPRTAVPFLEIHFIINALIT